jgi:hypothetical protein
LNFNRVTEREFYAAHYDTRNRLCPASTGFGGHTPRQNVLVGRRQIRTLPKAGEIIGALCCLES